MKYLFYIVLFGFSGFLYADTYQDLAGTSQMVADSFGDLWSYFYNDVPSLFERFFGWIIVWLVKAKIYSQIELIKFSAGVAKVIIADLQIVSTITAQVNALPQDVRQALVDMRLFDGLNILLHAFATKYVMRFIG